MSGFVAVADFEFVKEACAELSAQFEFTKRHHSLWLPDEIFGVWVGSHRALDLRFQSSFGFLDRWMLVWLDEPLLPRIGLLDALVSNSVERVCPEPRFMPVFSRRVPERVRSAELTQMRSRFPHEVGAPLLMNPMTGSLTPPN